MTRARTLINPKLLPSADRVRQVVDRAEANGTTAAGNGDIPFHPLADVFPLIEGDEFAALVADVKENGIDQAVWLYEDMILEGRNRYRAGRAAGVEIPLRTYRGSNPLRFVISANLRRRHLNESQRAMVAARLATLLPGRPTKGLLKALTQGEAAAMLGVSERSIRHAGEVKAKGTADLARAVDQGAIAVSAAAEIAGLPAALQTELVVQGEKAILAAAKEIRSRKAQQRRSERMGRIVALVSNNQPLPQDRKFPLLYADPAWEYDMGDTDRSVENHYPTMSLEQICALPVRDLAAEHAVLFLWIPEPHLLRSGPAVLAAWDFLHKSGFVWDKVAMGMGKYTRLQHEHLLICTRGAVPVPPDKVRPRSVYSERRRKHSEKPAKFYELIEQMYPEFVVAPPGPPLMMELFARSTRPGWASWGNQAAVATKARAA